jgi:hypothetical protein
MLNTNITIKLIYEGIARELVSIFQKIRKLKGFYIDDRVNIILKCNSEKIIYAIKNFKSYIKEEVLIVNLKIDSYLDHLDSVKYTINNQEIKVKMDKF